MAGQPEMTRDSLFVASIVRTDAATAPSARRAVFASVLGLALFACIVTITARGNGAVPAELFGIYVPELDPDAPRAAELREEFERSGHREGLQKHLDDVLRTARTTMASSASLLPKKTEVKATDGIAKLYDPRYDADNPGVAKRAELHAVHERAMAADDKMKARLNLEAKVAMLTQRSSTMLALQKEQADKAKGLKSAISKHHPWSEGPPKKPDLKAFHQALMKRLAEGRSMNVAKLESSEHALFTRYHQEEKSYARWQAAQKRQDALSFGDATDEEMGL